MGKHSQIMVIVMAVAIILDGNKLMTRLGDQSV